MAFVDDTARDISYALRTFRRTPLVALTIVATVALGLGLVTVAFTVLNALLFRVDAVPDVHEMFALERPRTSDGQRTGFTRAQFDALRRETTVFSGVYAERSQVDSRVDGRLMWGTFVSGNFFQVLGVRAAIGRPLMPADDEPSGGQPVMVLSDHGWDRLFARDPAVLGRRVRVNGIEFEIVGVMENGFRGLEVAPDDYWAPLSMLAQVRPARQASGDFGDATLEIVGRLKPAFSRQTATSQLAVWNARQPTAGANDPSKNSEPRVMLVPRRGTVPRPLEVFPVAAALFFAFGLILVIGCANVANLLLARGVARQREIGIQLSLGATRCRIIRKLLTESLLLSLAAAAGGFAISRVALDAIINAMITSMPPDIGDVRLLVPNADWRVLLFLIAAAVVSTAGFALAPALQATRIDPVKTIRGEAVGDARPRRARSFLIGVQVSASALLLIAAGVFLRSAYAAAMFDPGMRTADTVVVQIANESTRDAIARAVTEDPSVAAVAAALPDLPPQPAFAAGTGGRGMVTPTFVSPEYFSVFDIAIVRGRAFTAAERTSDVAVAIVSETTARTLWPNSNPVGRAIRLEGDTPSRTFTVTGVARDVPGLRIAPFNKAVVYLPTSAAMPKSSLALRVHGDPELARQRLLDRLTAIDPDMGREVLTMRTLARVDTYFLKLGFWLTVVLGGLALALTLSGLFSVLSYLVEQRTREIGVRMALGATTRDVMRLVLIQSIRPVGYGLVIGGVSAAGVAALLLAAPVAAGIGEIVYVLDPLAYAGGVFTIIVSCLMAALMPATRAAHLDPALTLRQE
jgi:putative ABC transport system permease protein